MPGELSDRAVALFLILAPPLALVLMWLVMRLWNWLEGRDK
jgi:flagellar biogenesis protein FliO